MAQYEIHPDYPDVLILYGEDLFLRDANIVQIMSNIPGCPVNANSHDFVVVHTIGGGGADYNSYPNDPPVKMKAIINFNVHMRTIWREVASVNMHILLHEIGHYWLVPGFEMKLSETGDFVPVKSMDDFNNAFLNSVKIPPLCLKGHQNAHWSCYLSAGTTSFESAEWVFRGRVPNPGAEPGYENLEKFVNASIADHVNGDIGGIRDVNVVRPFHDLDQVIIGCKTPAEAYAGNNNTFYEIIPQWVTDLNLMTGICLVFESGTKAHFGFKDGHHKLALTVGGRLVNEVSIGNWNTPQLMLLNDAHVALRMVKRGSTYICQARLEFRRWDGCLTSLYAVVRAFFPARQAYSFSLFSDTGNIIPGNPQELVNGLRDWKTIASFDFHEPVVAGGYMTKIKGQEIDMHGAEVRLSIPLVDTHLSWFQVKMEGETARTINQLPAETVTGADFSSSLNDGFIFHLPKPGPRLIPETVTTQDLGNFTVIPHNTGMNESFDDFNGVDNIPKLLTRIGGGDFIMGGKIKINRSAHSPMAMGGASDATIWGFRSERRTVMNGESNIKLSANSIARQAHLNGLKYAFIVKAHNREEITEEVLRNFNAYRQAVPFFFTESTNNRGTIHTALR